MPVVFEAENNKESKGVRNREWTWVRAPLESPWQTLTFAERVLQGSRLGEKCLWQWFERQAFQMWHITDFTKSVWEGRGRVEMGEAGEEEGRPKASGWRTVTLWNLGECGAEVWPSMGNFTEVWWKEAKKGFRASSPWGFAAYSACFERQAGTLLCWLALVANTMGNSPSMSSVQNLPWTDCFSCLRGPMCTFVS